MQSIFSPDSKIMQALSGMAGLTLLNVVFVITCIHVFNIGAASGALYTVVFRIVRQEDSHIFRTYFKAFGDNFR